MQKFLKTICFLTALPFGLEATAGIHETANEPDSAYLFSYASTRNQGHNGLHFAYSIDGENWQSIDHERSFLKSDYGEWGGQKRMLTPWLTRGADGMWHCVWSLNETHNVFAHAASPNLTKWHRQSYPATIGNGCHTPVMKYNAEKKQYEVTYRSEDKAYQVVTTDFKTWSKATERPVTRTPGNEYQRIELPTFGAVDGQVQRVEWEVIDHLLKYSNHRKEVDRQVNEPVYLPELEQEKEIEATISLQTPLATKNISPNLIGIFFEDINYGADGGLYAELIQNRGFEYDPADTKHRWGWGHTTAWSLKNNQEGDSFTIDTVAPLHPNNPHYAILTTKQPGAALCNEGFDGIPVKKGEKYDVSLFSKQLQGKSGRLTLRLTDENGKVIAEKKLAQPTDKWKKTTTVLTATADAAQASLMVIPEKPGSVALDMISLFPQKTFKGRKNGLRADLAQTLADMKPRFIRFPGGCVSHGDGLHNIYRWINTVGPLEARKPMRNIWNYHQSMGLGFYEYFQFCEDIGAEPVPVLAAGVPCQNSSVGGSGQQGGIPLEEMDEYVEEILALIEWANGDPKKSKWAKMRAEAGHPKPFNLKYLGIGNEDLITNIFEERFKMIFDAVKEKYPEITVIGTVGPFWEGTDYEEGWDLATRYKVPMVDEHYYNSPGWYLNFQNYYDRYDRNKAKVYLGEYAAHIHGRPNNIQTALVEALHLTNVERNGDIVVMTSYAPLLAKERHTQWNPDLIYFNNHEVKPTVGYHVQKLFGNNCGTEYLSAKFKTEKPISQNARKRIAYSIVRDETSGDLIIKLVNLLPNPVKMNIDLSTLDNDLPTTAIRTILTGKLDDRKATPTSDTMNINGKQIMQELPAYSFTLIRL